MKNLLLSLCASLLFGIDAAASNLQREQQIADQIIENITDGEPIWLEEQTSRFLAVHMQPSTHQTLGGVILLHGMGANPDTSDVIHPLRTSLAEQGWETLSIQLPLASHDAGIDDYQALILEAAPRIQKAIDFFNPKQNSNLVLIGHGLGARMGLAFLDKTPAQEIRAFIAIGLAAEAEPESKPVLEAMSKINIPMLDIFGSRDLEDVMQSAKPRRIAAIRSGRTSYRQDRIAGADHCFRGLESTLQIRVGAWIRKVVEDIEIDGRVYPAINPDTFSESGRG